MNKNQLVVGVVALVVGLLAGYLLSDKGEASPAGTEHSMHGQMESMTAGLEGKTGDAFDKAFLAEMIVHHEGAVDMAEAALANAKHEEIKTMANAIISAQTSEIAEMKAWQKEWFPGDAYDAR